MEKKMQKADGKIQADLKENTEIQSKPEKIDIYAMSEGDFIDFCSDFENSEDPDSFMDMM